MKYKTRGHKNPFVTFVIVILSIIFFVVPVSVKYCRNNSSKSQKIKIQYEYEPYNSSENDYRYHIKFNDDFKKGLTLQDDLGISIIIAVDCSGSMTNYPASGNAKPKYVIASESLTEIMRFLESFYKNNLKNENIKLKIGIMRFSSKPEFVYELTGMDDSKFIELRNITSNINNFIPAGRTAIGDTMEKGAEVLAQSGTIFKSLIIITDGENTSGETPFNVLTAIINNLNNKSTEEFPVMTDNILVSFVSFDLAANVFYMEKETGARVTSAQDKDELKEALKSIFLADITKLEAE